MRISVKQTLIKNIQFVDVAALKTFNNFYILIQGDRIQKIGTMTELCPCLEQLCEEVIDGQGLHLAPAFIDIQNNGVFGNDFSNSKGVIHNAEAIIRLRQSGLGYIGPTIITSSRQRTLDSIKKVLKAREMSPLDKMIVEIHLEGPYISSQDGPRGCHNFSDIRQPDVYEYLEWRKLVGELVGPDFPLIITLAPEIKGAESFMAGVKEWDRRNGIKERMTIFCIGHSGAGAREFRNAVRFLSSGTHVWNAYGATLNKGNLGWPAEIICNPDLWASFIPCDEHFKDINLLKMSIRAKGVEKTVLVTDSTPATGLPDDVYPDSFAGQTIEINRGSARVPGTERLAGSTLFMDRAVSNAVKVFGFSLPEAVRMTTLNPAQFLGLDKEIGSLGVGKKASLVLFSFVNQTVVVRLTMLEGEVVYRYPVF